ncbi:MAG: maltose alpha-D-glucosyltransferase [Verrucomicrobiae bacterium]|nr:maltose alpha-D-glucosyltransferase [Verrucomicrobiae bacterium]
MKSKRPAQPVISQNSSLWYKDAVLYELRIRTFYDSNGDGVGDFRGLTEKLDYLTALGSHAPWALPSYPSPMRDDGYDISDYTNIDPSYGTLQDFRTFLDEAHRRGIRVITELVLNHTSDQHPWFQRARLAQRGSKWRDFYVWSDTVEKYGDARIIFKDFEVSNWTWDPVAQSYFWHRFYSHQPDLNYDSPEVRRAMIQVVDFWLGMGVDGLRLDAVPYLYEREGTNCENLPETHAYLKELRRHVDENYPNRMLLAEANQWPEDAVAYFGNGDACQMAFHFPIMPRLFMGLQMEDRFPVIDILQQTPPIPNECQWAVFLRNHDELTLEMVTDSERDYMHRVYAREHRARINLGIRRRLAPLLGNHRRKIELLNSLLFSMPGTPVLYYGDEIGMGDNIYLGDRNGVRTPMQWSPDRNGGFSTANPQKLILPVIIDPEYHYETVNVETQFNNPNSLLWWTKRLIALRKRHQAFGRGSLEFLPADNRKVLVFLRTYGEERILVVCNLSRFVQAVEVDLSAFKGMVPLELFGQTRFPRIGDLPYFFTIGPHGFYWFSLQPAAAAAIRTAPPGLDQRCVETCGTWEELVASSSPPDSLVESLQAFLGSRRWYAGRHRVARSLRVARSIPIPYGVDRAYLLFLLVEYQEHEPETYLVPVAFRERAAAEHHQDILDSGIAWVSGPSQSEGLLYDAVADPIFRSALLESIATRRRVRAGEAEIVPYPAPKFRRALLTSEKLDPVLPRADQRNTTIIYGRKLILKLIRRFEDGINPELEIGRYFAEYKGPPRNGQPSNAGFSHVPAWAGAIEFREPGADPRTLGVLQEHVDHEGSGWSYMIDQLDHFFERALASGIAADRVPRAPPPWDGAEIPAQADELIGHSLEMVRLLGRRTAQVHLALAAGTEPEFLPESITPFYQRGLYQSMRVIAVTTFQALRARGVDVPPEAAHKLEQVLASEAAVHEIFRRVLSIRIEGQRIRCHGDYHLGQVLFTGKDFVLIDFEGVPSRPVSERRFKRSPLRDVSSMLSSFRFAAHFALRSPKRQQALFQAHGATLELWADYWRGWTRAAFLRSYLETAEAGSFLTKNPEERRILIKAYGLEKDLHDLGHDLLEKPIWVEARLDGILELARS